MKVTLYRDIKSEKWYSMERYASALACQLRIINHDLRIKAFRFTVPKMLFRGRKKFFWRFKAYPFLARFFQGDINHIIDHSYARAIRYLDPKKTVITCHDLIPLDYEKDSQALEIFKETLSYLPRARKIITVSQATKKDLVEKLGISYKKVAVVYEGVEGKFKIQSPNDKKISKLKLRIPEEKRVILHVGNSLEYKNMEGLLKAFFEVVKKEKEVVLVKVGRFTKDQSNLMSRLGLRLDLDIYERPGLSEGELVSLYNLADVTVQPSFKEGFGFPVLESMACGTPVVCSNVSSLPEVGGKVAVYCNPKDPADIAKKILKVLRLSKSKYTELSKAGLAQAGRFTWEKCAEETVAIYQKITRSVR